MKTAFITGVCGQDGAYLAKLLLDKGYRVLGGFRRTSSPNSWRLEALGIDRQIEMIEFDLAESNRINRVVQDAQADEFYNLGAQSFVAYSWDLPAYTTDVDAVGVLRVLDALRSYSPQTRFYQASSSEMYGKLGGSFQNEQSRFDPRSPYAVAKTFGHYITVNYRESFGLHASSGILFNHESPLRGIEFVTRKISSQLALLARGGTEPVFLGNMNAKRDWGYAGDYVEGMWRMLQQEVADDYVLATGAAVSVRQFVELTSAALGMDVEWSGEGVNETGINRKTGRLIVGINERFYRPADVEFLCGDATKARTVLGWQPAVTINQLAEMMAKADYDALAN